MFTSSVSLFFTCTYIFSSCIYPRRSLLGRTPGVSLAFFLTSPWFRARSLFPRPRLPGGAGPPACRMLLCPWRALLVPPGPPPVLRLPKCPWLRLGAAAVGSRRVRHAGCPYHHHHLCATKWHWGYVGCECHFVFLFDEQNRDTLQTSELDPR